MKKINLEKIYICTECNEICDTWEEGTYEREEFWGAPCYRKEYETKSECCDAEVNTAHDHQINGWPVSLEAAKELGWDQ